MAKIAATALGVLAFYVGLTYLPILLSGAGAGHVVAAGAPPLAFVVLVVALEMTLFHKKLTRALSDIGLSRFSSGGMHTAAAYLAPLVVFFPMVSLIAGAPTTLTPDWGSRLATIVLNNGLAEEVMMRGFLFRHLREKHSFWRAASASTAYFAAYHLPLIVTEGAVIGILGILVAIPLGFLTALIFERGNGSIWGPAVTHTVTNGVAMLFVLPAGIQPAVSAFYLLVATTVSTAIVLRARRSRVSPKLEAA